ncbi:hypothetical protein HQ560_01425, partial [bacterium]|nr:hypothetical protein [bacterium]
CHVQITDDAGNPMAARAPVRLWWTAGDKVVRERYVLTDAKGSTYAQATWPHGVTQMTLEATEMLNGQSTTVSGSREPSTVKFLFEPPRATTHVRGASVRALLARAKRAGSIGLVLARPDLLDEQDVDSLRTELAKEGIELLGPKPLPATPEPGVTIAVGQMPTRDALGELLWLARQRGLLTRSPLSASIRGAGAGSIAALIAPRAHEEHFIAFLGGDRPALKAVVSDFTKSLGIKRGIYSGRAGKSLKDVEVGKESQAVVPRLSDLVGVRLDGVRATPDGKHLLVTAKGYHRNLALLRDDGKNATILRTARIGQAPTVNSAFVSADGARFGASARMTARFGQAMHVIDGDSTRVFPAFGDIGGARNRFAVSDDGNTVIAPGTYGAVCWRRDGKAWREAWAIDYWKTFQTLDWPVADKQERIPQFHAVIPRGADHALILFGEFTDQGWVTPDNACSAWLAAVNLADGKERWRFDVPILKTLLLPTLHTSANGSKTLLQVQMGSWKKESFRLFTVANGKALGSWDAKVAPLGAAVADATGNCALAFERRLLELRRPNGALVHNMYWKSQPVSVAFAADGESIFVADDAERLSRVDGSGAIVWQKPLGSVAALAVAGDRVYAARWDGRLQAWSADGKLIWTLDCTPAMVDADPMATVVASTKLDPATLVQATRPSTTTTTVPKGENMLRAGKAALTLGGTKSWMSDGKVQVKPEALTNGETDDVATPWLHLDEVFWDATAGRQVYAEIAFKAPTDVRKLTVHESKAFPNSIASSSVCNLFHGQFLRCCAGQSILKAANNSL